MKFLRPVKNLREWMQAVVFIYPRLKNGAEIFKEQLGPEMVLRSLSDKVSRFDPFLGRDVSETRDIVLFDYSNGICSPCESASRINHVDVYNAFLNSVFPLLLTARHAQTFNFLQMAQANFEKDLTLVLLDAHLHCYGGSESDETSKRVFGENSWAHEALTTMAMPVLFAGARVYGPDELKLIGNRERTFFYPATWRGNPWSMLKSVTTSKVYLSLCLDVLDPSETKGVVNPEPGGWSYRYLEHFLKVLFLKFDVVGADIAEVVPDGYSEYLAAILAYRILGLKFYGREVFGEST